MEGHAIFERATGKWFKKYGVKVQDYIITCLRVMTIE